MAPDEEEIEGVFLGRVFAATWAQVRLDLAAGHAETVAWLQGDAFTASYIVEALIAVGLDPEALRDALIRTVGRGGSGLAGLAGQPWE